METSKLLQLRTLAPALLLAAFAASASTGTYAQSRCPAGGSGCTTDNYRQRISEIMRNGGNDHATSRSTYEYSNRASARKASRVGRIVEDCVTCTIDALRDGMNRYSTGSGGGVR